MTLVYADPVAAVVFYIVLVVFLGLEARGRVRTARNREGDQRDRGSYAALTAAIGIGIGGAFGLASVTALLVPAGLRWPLFAAGVALMIVGIALRQWSIRTLGRWFTYDVRIGEHQPVVDAGPYRLVRHPSYTAAWLTLVGIGLAFGNWASLAIAAIVPVVGIAVRIGAEERALADGLGETYRAYAATRRRLIPGVW